MTAFALGPRVFMEPIFNGGGSNPVRRASFVAASGNTLGTLYRVTPGGSATPAAGPAPPGGFKWSRLMDARTLRPLVAPTAAWPSPPCPKLDTRRVLCCGEGIPEAAAAAAALGLRAPEGPGGGLPLIVRMGCGSPGSSAAAAPP